MKNQKENTPEEEIGAEPLLFQSDSGPCLSQGACLLHSPLLLLLNIPLLQQLLCGQVKAEEPR